MWNLGLRDVGLVSGVEQEQDIVRSRVFDPRSELLRSCNSAGRIVRKTEVNYIDMFPVAAGRLRDEIVFDRARQINDAFVAPVLARRPAVTGHYIGVDINRINRIG